MLWKPLNLKVINNLKVIQQKLYHVPVPKEELLEECFEPSNQGYYLFKYFSSKHRTNIEKKKAYAVINWTTKS